MRIGTPPSVDVKPSTTSAPVTEAKSKGPRSNATRVSVEDTGPVARVSPGRALASDLGIGGPIARPFERTLTPLASLDAVLRAHSVKEIMTGGASVIRTQSFRVEAQLRWLATHFPGKLGAHAKRAKALEDILGATGHAADMLKHGIDTGDKKVVKFWKKELKAQQKLAKRELEKHWTPGAKGYAIAAQAHDFAALDWATVTRGTLIDALESECRRVVDSALDMTVLDRLHALRRRGRWFALVAVSLDGAVQLTDKRCPAKFADVLKEEIAKSPFAQLPVNAVETSPVTVPRALFVAATKIIDEVGQIKDRGEAIEGIAKALVAKRGMTEAEAEVAAAKLHRVDLAEHKRDVARAQELYGQAREVFSAILADLEAQRPSVKAA